MDVGHLIGALVEDDPPRRDPDAVRNVGEEGMAGILRQRVPVAVHRALCQRSEGRRRAAAGQQLAGAAATLHRVALRRLLQRRMAPDMGGERRIEGGHVGITRGRRAALAAQQAVEVEQRACRLALARLPQRDRLHRQSAALARLPRQQVVARRERRQWVAPVEVSVDVPGLPDLERGVEDIASQRRRLPVGLHRLVEPAGGIENVAQGEARLGVLGLDGECLAEGARGLVQVASGVMHQPDAEHGAGVVGAERGRPAQGVGGAVEIPLRPQRLAEVEVGLGPGRVDLDRAAIGGKRRIQPAARLEHVAEVVMGAGVAGVESERPLQERRGLVHRIEPEGDQRTGFQRLDMVRPGGENGTVERARLGKPPGSRMTAGAAHRLAHPRRREPLRPVRSGRRLAVPHPIPPLAVRDGRRCYHDRHRACYGRTGPGQWRTAWRTSLRVSVGRACSEKREGGHQMPQMPASAPASLPVSAAATTSSISK